MKTSAKIFRPAGFLTIFGVSLTLSELAASALAAIGFFRKEAALAILSLAVIAPAALAFRRKIRTDAATVLMTIAFAAISIAIAWNPEPTVFSGRDQGSFSEAAIRLSQNHGLEFSTEASREFFRIYGPGTALNFPGFSYTAQGNLVTHFSIGYVSWLALFYSVFGMSGLSIANATAFFLFILSFHGLLRSFLKPWPALIGVAFALTSFVFLWLPGMTLGENLALGLLWFSAYQAVRSLKDKSRPAFLASLFGLLALSLTRIESWLFTIMLLSIPALRPEFRKIITGKPFGKRLAALSVAFLLVLSIGMRANGAFYVSSAKGLIGSFSGSDPGSSLFGQMSYLWRVFSLYAISQFVLLGFVGAAYFLYKKNFAALVPAIMILPSIAYLLHPGISQDHPWMLRRFAFSIIPAGMLYSSLLLDRVLGKRLYFNAVSFLMIAANLLVSVSLYPPAGKPNLLDETEKISKSFSDTDLVLIDREASGNGWNMLSGPMSFLEGKQSVYFFNPNDYAKLDRSRFGNVFLMVPDSNAGFYSGFPDFPDLSELPFEEYSVRTSGRIDTGSEGDPELPVFQETTVVGKIYKLNR